MLNTYLFSNDLLIGSPIIFAYEGGTLEDAEEAFKQEFGYPPVANPSISCEVIENNTLSEHNEFLGKRI